MNYSNLQRKFSATSNTLKHKLTENKPHLNNQQRDYEDDQNVLIPKCSDSSQVRDLKGKIKLVMTKLTSVKKQRDEFQKQNKVLQQQISTLQSNLRHMVSGFSNTSSNFPTYNQLVAKFAQFYKYECLDLFFDLLCPDMSIKGVIFFYYQSFNHIDSLVNNYFSPCLQSISHIGCLDSVQGPISNVLRKSFQSTYLVILQKLKNSHVIGELIIFLQNQLNIGQQNQQAYNQILQFIYKIVELKLCCYVSDPPFSINIGEIGKKVLFNPLVHDPFDGFVKPKDQCWIVLPSVQKLSQEKQTVSKSLVLQVSYDQIN